MLAILSDIHANLEALKAVLVDIENRSIEQIYCLGDIVGGGPDPSACVDIAMGFDLCLAGDWDQRVGNTIGESESQPARLREPIEWTRFRLSSKQLEFLNSLHSCEQRRRLTFAHGSPLDYVQGYVFPEVAYCKDFLRPLFAAFDGLFLCGHTHIPGVLTETDFHDPASIDFRYEPKGRQSIVNVGSVGQPRDKDARACYVVYDDVGFEFVRVEYDTETTRRKLGEEDGFPP